jgi:glutamyl-tRNA synthetase
VVDDAAQGVTEVVRGDDLLSSTARQIHLQELLDLPRPQYVHVPLVVDAEGQRLAKREGMPLTLAELVEVGAGPSEILGWIARSLGAGDTRSIATLRDLVDGFDPSAIPSGPCSVADFGQPG